MLSAAQRHREACLSCHRTAVQELIARRRHPAGQDCASCHMPKRRPSDAIHVRATDHLIRKPAAIDPMDPLVEKHDGNTPPYRGKVALYYPSRIEKASDSELYLAIAQVKHDANLEEGLRQLEAAILRHAPKQAEFYFELAEAYRRAGQREKSIRYYEEACSRAPANWRYLHRMATLLSEAAQERALKSLERALALAPKEPSVLEAMSDVLSRQGRLAEAVSTLQAALNLDPESAGALSRLGARLLQSRDPVGAEKAWREAVRLRPETATIRLNLANLLSSRGNFQEAEYHFKAAIQIDTSCAEGYLAYGMSLAAREDLNRAKEQFEAALARPAALSGTAIWGRCCFGWATSGSGARV
jgi:tetratricopeptide (TPR) repeat protein